jgi:uncharacterized protein (TIGR02646 family)
MQYIKKAEAAPAEWGTWFMTREKTPRRSYDYDTDYDLLAEPKKALEFLIQEQVGLCAYCQSQINPDTASIEHVIPKSFATEISTNYHNLVAVCKNPASDPYTNRSHCDKARGNLLIPSIIFYRNASIHYDKGKNGWKKNRFFSAQADGRITVNPDLSTAHSATQRTEIGDQANAFIEVLNLNHFALVANRRSTIEVLLNEKPKGHSNPSDYFRSQFSSYYRDKKRPNREFVLMYLFQKLQANPNDRDWLQRFLGPRPA